MTKLCRFIRLETRRSGGLLWPQRVDVRLTTTYKRWQALNSFTDLWFMSEWRNKFSKNMRYLKTEGTIRAEWSIFHTEEPQIRGWSQKKCTRWQHCVSNDAIFPAISVVVLENFRQLVQCNLSPGVCALGNERELKWRPFVPQVPRLVGHPA